MFICFFQCVESRGRTIHLLKENSKKIPIGRKRRKVKLLGTFAEFKQQTEEQKHEEPAMIPMRPQQTQADEQTQDREGAPVTSSFHDPNIIGNMSDLGDQQRMEAQQLQSLGGQGNHDTQSMPEDISGFKDITPMLTRSMRKK